MVLAVRRQAAKSRTRLRRAGSTVGADQQQLSDGQLGRGDGGRLGADREPDQQVDSAVATVQLGSQVHAVPTQVGRLATPQAGAARRSTS